MVPSQNSDLLTRAKHRSCPGSTTVDATGDLACYLYGIIGRRDLGEQNWDAPSGLAGGPVSLVPYEDLLAIVSLVSFADFAPETVESHLQDPVWLETAVRGHQRVLDLIHREATVLPAKFGCLYSTVEQMLAVLGHMHDAIVEQLKLLEGCDEWGVSVFADRRSMERRAAREALPMQQIQQRLATVTPGRAYFLRRELARTLADATDQTLAELAQTIYQHLARLVVVAQITNRSPQSRARTGETEIVRAAFLVRRSETEAFLQAFEHVIEGQEGLRGEYSGPWPPYNFARTEGLAS